MGAGNRLSFFLEGVQSNKQTNKKEIDGGKFVQMPFPPLMPKCNEGRRRLILGPVDSDLVDDLSRDLVGSFGLGWASHGWRYTLNLLLLISTGMNKLHTYVLFSRNYPPSNFFLGLPPTLAVKNPANQAGH